MSKFRFCTVVKVKHILPKKVNGWTNYESCMIWHKPRREITDEIIREMLREQYYMLSDDEIERIKIISWTCYDGYDCLIS